MRICPECESENVKPEMGELVQFTEGDINSWKCNDCGYIGLMPEKEDEETEEDKVQSHPDFYEKLIIISFMVVLGLLMYFYL